MSQIRISINPVMGWDESLQRYVRISEDGHYWMDEQEIPIRADRAAQAQAKQNLGTANSVAGQAGQEAGQDRGLLTAAYRNDINNPTGFTANQQNQQLTAAEAGGGGGGATGTALLEANRTHNTGNTSNVLDQVARNRMQNNAKASEGIAADSSRLAQAKRAAALSGTQGMYGQDVGTQLKAMGLSNEAINTELAAARQGWLQNAEGVADTIEGGAKAAASLGVHV
jgi:hypothetical protein